MTGLLAVVLASSLALGNSEFDRSAAEGAARIYTHGEKEILAYADRMENGIDVNINTVAEMKDLCDYLGMDSVAYLGDVDLSTAKNSSYK
jgi:hypothetical protein